jgi:tetratricopeptide (TPR) repeat protein
MSTAIERQLGHLQREGIRLREAGDYRRALSVAREYRDLLRRHHGERHPAYASCINSLALLHQDLGDYAAALPLLRQALEIVRATRGEAHDHFAAALGNLAGLYRNLGDYAAALPLVRQALEVRRAAYGESHPNVATELNNVAMIYHDLGDYAAALPLFRQASEIFRAGGETQVEFATGLDNLAMVCLEMGDHATALSLHQQALEVVRATRGETHPLFAQVLSHLGRTYRGLGDYAAALPLFRRALEIIRAALGEAHPHFALYLSHLAGLYREMGDYLAALPLYQQALEVSRALGEAHPSFASGLGNLALLYLQMGDYAAALPRAQQAVEALSAVRGETHPEFAKVLNTLGTAYLAIGDYATALRLYRQALEIHRAALGEAHPSFANGLTNLALVHWDMGDAAAALPLLRQALEVRRAALGEAHPEVAVSLANLAATYRVTADHAAALPLLRQALEIQRAALGEAHPHYGLGLSTLAVAHWNMGDHAAALPLLRRAVEVQRAALGEAHPKVAESLSALAMLCAAMDNPLEALPLLERAAAIEDRLIGQVFSVGAERQRLGFLATLRRTQHALLSLVRQQFPSSQPAVGAALDLVLRRKAVAAAALAAQRGVALGNKYPALRARFQEWATLRMQIAQRTLAGPGPGGVQAHRELLEQWLAQQERLETDLARQIPEMNLEQQLRTADRGAVARALPEGAALVEFVRLFVFDFKATGIPGERRRHPSRYLAFVLSAGDPEQVRLIDLGECDPIDRLIAEFRAAVTGESPGRNLENVTREPGGDTSATLGERLLAALFDPLAHALGACRRLFLSPDGDLNRLPLGVLPLPDGRRLLDAYRISYVSVGRDVLRFQADPRRGPGEPLVAADPEFDLRTGVNAAPGKPPGIAARAPRLGLLGWLFKRRPAPPRHVVGPAPAAPPATRRSRDLGRGPCHFAPLPGTRAEGESVARRLGVRPLLGGAALESRLKACGSPRILHLATHGFFLPDEQPDLNQPGRSPDWLGSGDGPGLGRLSGPGLENPMLRSGLALAGANTFLRGGLLPAEAEDGLLTAEDVAGMDLLDTELVVLSACETGLGAVHIGEGVFGLRRAFIIAGAKTLVMSLWRVPDLATAFLMDRFYDNLLTRGLDRDLALSEAQRATRDATVAQLKAEWLAPAVIERLAAGDAEARRGLEALAAKPDDHRPFESPFFWGAFICQGDPSPLPSTKTAPQPGTQAGA